MTYVLVLQSSGRNNSDLIANTASVLLKFLIFDAVELNHD
jgi:hypothetical protein